MSIDPNATLSAILGHARPFLAPLAAKVARVHGDHDPRLREVQEVFLSVVEALDAHVDDDGAIDAGEVAAPLHRIRELTDGFAPPPWACTSYRRLLAELQGFEAHVLGLAHGGAETSRYAPAP